MHLGSGCRRRGCSCEHVHHNLGGPGEKFLLTYRRVARLAATCSVHSYTRYRDKKRINRPRTPVHGSEPDYSARARPKKVMGMEDPL